MYGMRAGKRAGWTAIFVAAALVFTLFPGAAYGDTDPPEEMHESFEDITDPDPDDPIVYDEPYIVEELSDLREEDVKQYMMSDGTVAKAIFAEPVHYMDDEGEWSEIDNSLVLEDTEYSADENPELATEGGGAIVTVPEYTNAANSFDLRIAKEADQNKMVTLNGDGHTIDFSPIYNPADFLLQWSNAHNSKSKPKAAPLSADMTETPPEDPAMQVPADAPDSEGHEFIELERPESEVLFGNVMEDVDFQYIPTSTGVKENIIVRRGGKASYLYPFALSLKGLGARLATDGSIEVHDRRDSDDVKYTLPAPFMFDANEVYSSAVKFDIRRINSYANLQETLDPMVKGMSLSELSAFSDEEMFWMLATDEELEEGFPAYEPADPDGADTGDADMGGADAGGADTEQSPDGDADGMAGLGIAAMSEPEPDAAGPLSDPDPIEEDDVPDTAHDDYYEQPEGIPTDFDEEEDDPNLNLDRGQHRRPNQRGRALSRRLHADREALYVFTVTVDAEWMNDSERAFPVTIDPVLSTYRKRTAASSFDLQCIHYNADGSEDSRHNNMEMHVGRMRKEKGGAYVYCKTVFSFDAVPDLMGGSISKATLRVASRRDNNTKMVAIVKEGEDSKWDMDTGGDDTQVLDFATIPKTGTATFDITRMFAHGKNVSDDGTHNNNIEFTFVPYRPERNSHTKMAIPKNKPFLVLTYRAVNGLDGRWSTHSQVVGRAGTGYVNDYTGNLTFVHGDSSTPGSRMPVGVQHVYNSNESRYGAMNPKTYTDAGDGWRLNYMQTLTIPVGEADTGKYPYVWVDGDGTKHFFKRQDVSYYENGAERKVKADKGAAADEDGLGLYVVPVKEYTSSTSKSKNLHLTYPYKIVDKAGDLNMYFDKAGNLAMIRDANKREDGAGTGANGNNRNKDYNQITIGFGEELKGETLYVVEGESEKRLITPSTGAYAAWEALEDDEKALLDEDWDTLLRALHEYREACRNDANYSAYNREPRPDGPYKDVLNEGFNRLYGLALKIEQGDHFIRRDRSLWKSLTTIKTNLAWLSSNPDADGTKRRADRRARLGRCTALFDTAAKIDNFNKKLTDLGPIIARRIETVTDATGAAIGIGYDRKDGKGRIEKISDPILGGDISYGYTDGNLTKIAYPADPNPKPGAKPRLSLYGYTPDGFLETVSDWSGYKVDYTITGGRVTEVKESADGQAGQEYGISYGHGATTYTFKGTSPESDIATTYIFDTYGRTVSAYSRLAQSGEFIGGGAYEHQDADNKSNHRMAESAVNGSHTKNFLRNHSFERTSAEDVAWESYATYTPARGAGATSAVAMISSAGRHIGSRGVELRGDTAAVGSGAAGGYRQALSLSAGEYTYSGYVKTANLPAGAGAYIRITTADGVAFAAAGASGGECDPGCSPDGDCVTECDETHGADEECWHVCECGCHESEGGDEGCECGDDCAPDKCGDECECECNAVPDPCDCSGEACDDGCVCDAAYDCECNEDSRCACYEDMEDPCAHGCIHVCADDGVCNLHVCAADSGCVTGDGDLAVTECVSPCLHECADARCDCECHDQEPYVYDPDDDPFADGQGNTDEDVNDGWARLQVTFRLARLTEVTVYAELRGAGATAARAYFDCMQLESGRLANVYNIIEDSSFELAAAGAKNPGAWTFSNGTVKSGDRTVANTELDGSVASLAGDGPAAFDGRSAYLINAQIGVNKRLSAPLNVGPARSSYVLSGWVCLEDMTPRRSGRKLRIEVGRTQDGKWNAEKTHNLNVPMDREWMYFSVPLKRKDWSGRNVRFVVNNHGGRVYLDDLSLVRKDVQEREYDAAGRLRKATSGWQTTQLSPNSRHLVTTTVTANGNKFTNAYNAVTNKPAKTTETTGGSTTTYSYSYDRYGNPKGETVKGATTRIVTAAEHSEDTQGKYLTSSTDARGYMTTYEYDEGKGRLMSVTSPGNGSPSSTVTTANTYDFHGNATSVTTGGVTVGYGYNSDDDLSEVTRNGFSYVFDYDAFGNIKGISAAGQKLIGHEYEPANGRLKKTTYGNELFSITPVYNEREQLVAEEWQEGNDAAYKAYETWHGNDGRPAAYFDLIANRRYDYDYDAVGRVRRQSVVAEERDDDGNVTAAKPLYDLENSYNDAGSMLRFWYGLYDSQGASRAGHKYSYSYNRDDTPKKVTLPTGATKTYGYSTLKRQTSETYRPRGSKTSESRILRTSMSYVRGANNTSAKPTSSNLIRAYTNKIGPTDNARVESKFEYAYTPAGNISSITDARRISGNTATGADITYEYDALSQVTRENNSALGSTFVYTYNGGGNITSVREYGYTTAATLVGDGTLISDYEYNSPAGWKDQLTKFNGKDIKYDAIGNPKSYLGRTMEWERGRKLMGITGDGGPGISYEYDAAGTRTSKTVDGETTRYTTVGGMLVRETFDGAEPYEINYYYDAKGQVVSIGYKDATVTTEKRYFFTRNAQGDVIGVYNNRNVDKNGKLVSNTNNVNISDGGAVGASLVGMYVYDSWGKMVRIDYRNGDPARDPHDIMTKNPLRYRGYYYDQETKFYFLQTRYYDPEVKRFINADGLVSTGQGVTGYSMYSYCLNNPVNMSDPSGMCAFDVLGDFHCTNPRCPTSKTYDPLTGNVTSPTPSIGSPTTNSDPNNIVCGFNCTIAAHGHKGDSFDGKTYSHNGYDVSAAQAGGTNLFSAISGRVIRVGSSGTDGYGIVVDIICWDAKLGLVETRHAHLASAIVSVGDIVNQGDRIGTMGGTGVGGTVQYETHLHFRLLINGIPVDPLQYINKE